MVTNLMQMIQRLWTAALTLMVYQLCQRSAMANPTGGVVGQGAATFNTSGSTFTINQSSANAYINWSSFNISAGETTTFNQPSAASVTWNHVNDANLSTIAGTINANGYIVLQNQNGFDVAGSAVINAHGLVMTTSPTPAPNLDSGGAWTFSAPVPTAKIINFGQINITGGGSGYLIASDIENNGTISAPSGRIGLYAGEKVLVSTTPDGHGLSAEVTLPQGSVDNEGNLIADARTIAAQAKMVNQNGLVQANSVQNVNGVIELVASDVNLGANSTISAQGGSSGVSAGGDVTIQSGNSFSDLAGSTINVSGGAQGGDGGVVMISAPQMNALQTQVQGAAAAGYVGGQLQIQSDNITMDNNYVNALNNEFNGGLSEVDVLANNNIELSALWQIPDAASSSLVSLTAGNNITLDDNSGIQAGQNAALKLTAGAAFVPTAAQPTPPSGSYGIYLGNNSGDAFIQTQNGDINLWAANEVQVGWQGGDAGGNVNQGAGSITTAARGNIKITTLYGDVNAGSNPNGYDYNPNNIDTGSFYDVDSGLGGISTAAGGNVTIAAGGNVYSYAPSGSSAAGTSEGGSGAFGPEPGNVTINAGGNVYGHYVLANGVGAIIAGGDAGAVAGNPFALSLIDGTWNVNAPNGTIYLQEVRNPNGDFNPSGSGKNLFDYAPQAAVDLSAFEVDLTGQGFPRQPGSSVEPVIYPPILDISAGAGGVSLLATVNLFPSPYQSIDITTTDGGNLTAPVPTGNNLPLQLYMSDSPLLQWGVNVFTSAEGVHAATPATLNDPNPVVLNISGSMENLDIITDKATQITVGGDMINCGLSGENLHVSDVTSIIVAGQIYNQSSYSFVNGVSISPIPAADLPLNFPVSWDSVFTLALDSTILTLEVPTSIPAAGWAAYALNNAQLFPNSNKTTIDGLNQGSDQGLIYNQATGQLGVNGSLSMKAVSELSQPLTVLRFGANGLPETYTSNGKTYFVTDTINWLAPTVPAAVQTPLQTLATESSGKSTTVQMGYQLGGPGEFDVNAGSISLGSASGIFTAGVDDPASSSGFSGRFEDLASVTPSCANLNVTVAGDLSMQTSTIAAVGDLGSGGNVTVTSTSGSMDLGAPGLASSASQHLGYGLYTSSGGDVRVTAWGNINIDGTRIATYNGGNIVVDSLLGNVDVGSGQNGQTSVPYTYLSPRGISQEYTEFVYGSGILAETLVPGSSLPVASDVAALPGNITVETPRGDITATLGGITQQSLDGNNGAGPVINLIAGTFPSGTINTPNYSPGYTGNIDLGLQGVIGGTVNATANGNIGGLIISRQNSNINAAQNFVGTILSGGTADVAAGASVSGDIIGITGASVSGGNVTALVQSQSASVNGGAAVATLGGSAAATSTSQSAANATSNENNQQTTATADTGDDLNKKKKLPLLQRMKRVTVLLGLAAR